jgi:tetraacyldisaccharide 4'-kinase
VLSAIYGSAARLRRAWYEGGPARRRHLSRPVISVGNLVVGGAGKTPIVEAVARLLLHSGHRPAILSRGYGRRRRSDGVVVVSDGLRVRVSAAESGDEPQMLARSLRGVPVLVADDRYLAGRLAESHFDASVLLLDDGFQHLRLARTLDLLVVAAADLEAKVLPSGPLREPLAAARSADAVMVYGDHDEARRIAAALQVGSAFTVTPQYGPVHAIGDGQLNVEGSRIVAVAGIARPSRFFDALRARGFDVVREIAFRDHHWFTSSDLERIAAAAHASGASAVVTTAKDAVRMETLPRERTLAWATLPMEVAIEPAGCFTQWLGQHI